MASVNLPIDETQARERLERQLRNVRVKLISARREAQTLERQSGLRQDDKHMRVEIQRAQQRVQELETTEAELVQQLEPDQTSEPAASAREGTVEEASETPPAADEGETHE